jgi:hypothetical protein
LGIFLRTARILDHAPIAIPNRAPRRKECSYIGLLAFHASPLGVVMWLSVKKIIGISPTLRAIVPSVCGETIVPFQDLHDGENH